jgi:hypothetical protein
MINEMYLYIRLVCAIVSVVKLMNICVKYEFIMNSCVTNCVSLMLSWYAMRNCERN